MPIKAIIMSDFHGRDDFLTGGAGASIGGGTCTGDGDGDGFVRADIGMTSRTTTYFRGVRGHSKVTAIIIHHRGEWPPRGVLSNTG